MLRYKLAALVLTVCTACPVAEAQESDKLA